MKIKGTIRPSFNGSYYVELEVEDPPTAWNPASIPAASYDVPPQTMAEILDEYEREWGTEPVPEYEGPGSADPCGIEPCELCRADDPAFDWDD